MTPRRLTKEEFTAALQRGHGRALLHVREYGLEDVADLVLEACLHDPAYDPQCEDSRAKWLLDMFSETAEGPRFSAAIISALASETDIWDLQQLCELAALLGERGDEKAHFALRSRALQQAAGHDEKWVGASELVRLDGVDGVVQLARCYGKLLIQDPEDMIPPLNALFFDIEGGVPAEVPEMLQALSSSEPEISAYWNFDLRDRESRAHNLISEDTMREQARLRHPLPKILANAAAAVGTFPGQYVQFGKHATSEELEIVFQRLMTEPDEQACIRLLWIFRRTKMPRLDPRLWHFAASTNQQLQEAAYSALARLRDHSIGEHAREKLRGSALTEMNLAVLELFVRNYRPDDGELICAALRGITPETDFAHGTGWTILDICAEIHAPQLLEALNWVYEHTPCGNCREKAIKNMLTLGEIAPGILKECLYDANEGIQKMARNWKKPAA
jgi:hypothetical protein